MQHTLICSSYLLSLRNPNRNCLQAGRKGLSFTTACGMARRCTWLVQMGHERSYVLNRPEKSADPSTSCSVMDNLNTVRTELLNCFNARSRGLTFRHLRPVYRDRHFATLQRTLFIYLINKYISLSDICLTVHH